MLAVAIHAGCWRSWMDVGMTLPLACITISRLGLIAIASVLAWTCDRPPPKTRPGTGENLASSSKPVIVASPALLYVVEATIAIRRPAAPPAVVQAGPVEPGQVAA